MCPVRDLPWPVSRPLMEQAQWYHKVKLQSQYLHQGMDQVSAIKDGPEPRLVEYWWDHVHSTPRDERVAKTEKYMQTDHSILNILYLASYLESTRR